MPRAHTIDVVIGNAWGDEGKGHVVDWLAQSDSCVVRFNGGAQAGHTVVTPNGLRHVFHHVGSGALKGAATFWSRFCAVDPIAFVEEWAGISEFSGEVIVDPMAPVVTPYDVLLQQLSEKARGVRRHGSCGTGFGEAMRRVEEDRETLVVADLDSPLLEAKLDAIRAAANDRILRLVDFPAADTIAAVRARFLAACGSLLSSVLVKPAHAVLDNYGHLVFEGAQGLLLDRHIGAFPHVTRSKTGLVNVEALLGDDFVRARVYFVSRCYMTRHGPGPLREELAASPVDNAGETNVLNDWQGAFRYGPYDPEVLEWARTRALAEVGPVRPVRVVTTCLDQIRGTVPVVGGGWLTKDDFLRGPSHMLGLGPTREGLKTALELYDARREVKHGA